MLDKHRFEIWLQTQHPYKHSLSDFGYSNPALPGVSDVNSALNWVFKVLYPTTKPAVATPADLPLIGNTINDYRVVTDDGDGKNAGYRWEQREGEVSPSWHKVFDFDWSTDSILAAFMDVTQDLYVYQQGKQDLDPTGVPITGTYAGQLISGGTQANQNLTLRANSGDGTGAHTGYVQSDSSFRPAVGFIYDLGTSSEKWKDFYMSGTAKIGNLTLASGAITDLNNLIDFSTTSLLNTADMTATNMFATSKIEVGPLAGNALILQPGSITDESGAISFGNENLSTTGTFASGVATIDTTLILATGSITDTSGAIDFGNEDLSTTGTFSAGNATVTRLDSDNIRLDGNTVSILNVNGNLILQANGTGVVDIQNPMTTLGQTVTGILAVTGQIDVDNITLNGNQITTSVGNLDLFPTGYVNVGSMLAPSSDDSYQLGDATLRWTSLFISSAIGDGTNLMNISDLLSLRDINVGVGVGYTLFWDGTKWTSSLPDSEIDHTTINNLTLGDAGHTQFVMLAGRSGGQTVQGGTGASENLILESTANASKGNIQVKDKIIPFTTAAYSGGWSGTDLGDSSHYYNDVYTKGEHKGFRLENFTSGTLPSSSAQNPGRSVWATDNNKIYVDSGSTWIPIGAGKYLVDTSWDGVTLTQDFNTSSSTVQDARNAIWQLCDNTNDFERVYCVIKAINATTVRVTVNPALPAGSYRLIGLE